jgi:hypothetical protein
VDQVALPINKNISIVAVLYREQVRKQGVACEGTYKIQSSFFEVREEVPLVE